MQPADYAQLLDGGYYCTCRRIIAILPPSREPRCGAVGGLLELAAAALDPITGRS
jgi:hypothetical protein